MVQNEVLGGGLLGNTLKSSSDGGIVPIGIKVTKPQTTTAEKAATKDASRAAMQLRRIRWLLLVFMAGLVLSGATAIPLETELRWLTSWVGGGSVAGGWLLKIRDALIETNAKYPFIAYGTDWLAFGHFAIAVAFVGALRNPIRNVWVIEFGMIACVMVVPYALFMGGLRGIPIEWRLVDCSFGILGIIPLWYCRRLIKRLEMAERKA